VDAKGKKKGGAAPSTVQLLAQRMKADEEAGLALQAEAGAESADGAPAVVYLLSDFPSSAEEAEQLMKASTEDQGMLDGVLHFVWRPGATASGSGNSGGSSSSGSDSGAATSSVGAFDSLPHLDQARAAAAASRASSHAT
jgi:hypothetical protein